ncbi:MAG TPA: DUF1573 domain-containing protein [Thermoanaerobaculia bacterium]|nr:DUF1573 domain-containing protein [Thermoanaerobaculia bacterium]
MPEEFGTVNLKQGTQQREIEMLRRHYRAHRESLSRMIGDAPSEHLAGEYQKLISEIDMAVRKLDELEGKAPVPSMTDTNPSIKVPPGNRPLVRAPEAASVPPLVTYEPPATRAAQNRIAIIVLAGLIVLGIIGWLIWRASSERKAAPPVVEQRPTTTTTAPPAVTPAPRPVVTLKVAPTNADYGTIRKGTRAVRQFQVTNTGDTAIDIEVTRSACRCLFYDYNGKLPAKGQETITVTIDGARAKTGTLQERVDVHAKKDPSMSATFTVQATIK